MNGLSHYNTSINITALSPKQLLGECIDLSARMLKDLISHFLEMNPEHQSSSPLPSNHSSVPIPVHSAENRLPGADKLRAGAGPTGTDQPA